MKRFKEFLGEAKKEAVKDSKGNTLEHGDKLHNPHTGDVAVFDAKKKKLEYHDGGKVDAKRAGISDWWHKVDDNEYETHLNKSKKSEADREELSRATKNLMK